MTGASLETQRIVRQKGSDAYGRTRACACNNDVEDDVFLRGNSRKRD